MDASALLAPEYVSLFLAGGTMVALGVWLFFLDVSNAAQRVFALLLALRGLTFFMGPLRVEAETLAGSALWANLAPYLVIAVVPLVVAFLSLYPRRRGLAKVPFGMASLAVVTVALETWYAIDHGAYARLVLVPGQPVGYADFGPLFLFTGLRLPVLALAGLILAGDYRHQPKGSAGFSLFLMVAAFTLNGLFDGMLAALDLRDVLRAGGTDWLPWVWTRWWLPVLALPLSIATCLRLLPVLRAARRDPELQEITRFFLVALPLAVASPFIVDVAGERVALFILAIWRLAIPLLLAYALLRYQLFDIDLKIKDGVRRGIILGAFTVTFFLVSEAAESLLEGDRGPIFGVVSAGVLALASRPVQGFASRTADSLMPDTKPIAQQTYAERLRFYLDQYLLVAYDGHVTAKERRMLDRLRATLSLPEDAAAGLEEAGEMPDQTVLAAAEAAHADEATKDTKLEVAVKATVTAGILALVFGMLSQGIESVVPLSNQVAGLISAALVAVTLGPIENLADRLTHRLDPSKATDAKDEAERRQAFRAALATAFEDGSLSERDLHYLAGLQKRLRIPWAARWRMERQVRRSVGL